MGWKKEEERALFKNKISAAERRRGNRSSQKKTSVRTVTHGRHFPDLPGGEITIEVSSTSKHCTHTATKKSPRIKMGLKKKKERALFKNRISAATEEEGEIEK